MYQLSLPYSDLAMNILTNFHSRGIVQMKPEGKKKAANVTVDAQGCYKN